MTIPVLNPAFLDKLPEDVRNSVKARKHLNAMDPVRRAQLEREWLAAEHHREPISDESKARAKAEWETPNA